MAVLYIRDGGHVPSLENTAHTYSEWCELLERYEDELLCGIVRPGLVLGDLSAAEVEPRLVSRVLKFIEQYPWVDFFSRTDIRFAPLLSRFVRVVKCPLDYALSSDRSGIEEWPKTAGRYMDACIALSSESYSLQCLLPVLGFRMGELGYQCEKLKG